MKAWHFNPRIIPAFFTFMIIGITPGLFAAESGVLRLSEPVEVTATHEVFGSALPETGKTLSLSDLMADNEKYLDQEVLVETRIAKVCQKKGCFFVATEGAATARVTFKDYGFFIPTDSGGKDVVLLGTFSRKSVSKEQAEHYAADLGEKAAPLPEKFEYSIVASAVKIPRD
ncbi:MAG: DUF4920 domain-containing protein [Lysobacterales bacterium]